MAEKSAKQTLGRVVKETAMPDLTKRFSTQQLAQAITAKRTSMKLTLIDVSNALAISKPTLIKIEKGDTSVKLNNLLKVMEYLGLSFSLVSDGITSNNSLAEVNDDWF